MSKASSMVSAIAGWVEQSGDYLMELDLEIIALELKVTIQAREIAEQATRIERLRSDLEATRDDLAIAILETCE